MGLYLLTRHIAQLAHCEQVPFQLILILKHIWVDTLNTRTEELLYLDRFSRFWV